MEGTTNKEQMSSLLRKAQQLQMMVMGYPLCVDITVHGQDLESDSWLVMYITEIPGHKVILRKDIYPFRDYAYNLEQLAQFKELIMSRIEL